MRACVRVQQDRNVDPRVLQVAALRQHIAWHLLGGLDVRGVFLAFLRHLACVSLTLTFRAQ